MVRPRCGRPLLWHAMWQDLDRTPLQTLRILHHLLRMEAWMRWLLLLIVVVVVMLWRRKSS